MSFGFAVLLLTPLCSVYCFRSRYRRQWWWWYCVFTRSTSLYKTSNMVKWYVVVSVFAVTLVVYITIIQMSIFIETLQIKIALFNSEKKSWASKKFKFMYFLYLFFYWRSRFQSFLLNTPRPTDLSWLSIPHPMVEIYFALFAARTIFIFCHFTI